MATMDRESAEIGGEDGRMDSNSPSWPASRGRKSRKIYTHSRVTDVTAKIDRQRDSPSRAKQQQHGQGQGQGQGTGQGRGCSHANHGERLMGGHVNSRIAVAAGCDVVRPPCGLRAQSAFAIAIEVYQTNRGAAASTPPNRSVTRCGLLWRRCDGRTTEVGPRPIRARRTTPS
jgi:hypothetical protein